MSKPDAMTGDLPKRPHARILRAAEASAWLNGYGFLDAARREARQLRDASRRAYELERARGYEEGKAQGSAEAARLVSEAAIKVDRYLGTIKGEVAILALDVVKRMLGEFDVSMLVAKAASHAVAQIRRAKYLKVRVHPNAAAMVQNELDALMRASDVALTVEISADDTLDPSACAVSTDIAVIDASIEAQLAAIAAALASRSGEQP